MSSYKGLGPKKQFWPIRLQLSKPFHRQLFQYAEFFFDELLSNTHRMNCPTPVGRTNFRPLTCCVISLAQNILLYDTFSNISYQAVLHSQSESVLLNKNCFSSV